MAGAWPSVAPKARTPCLLPLLLLGLAAQRALGLKIPFRTNAEMQERVVIKNGTAEDPYETAYHYDDWVSGVAAKLINHSSPTCYRDVPSPRSNCKFMSKRLCDHKSVKFGSLKGGHEQCLKHKKSCVVVGSSQHLLAVSWGDFIDSHDVVIRINGAPSGTKATKPDARDELGSHVGTRTDVRFVNQMGNLPSVEESHRPMCLFLHNPMIPEGCGSNCWRNPALCNVSCSEKGVRSIFCIKGKSTCDLNKLECKGNGMTEDKDWGDNYVFMDNVHAGIADQVVPHSTAGFKAVMYAMTTCENVSILGFGPSCSGVLGDRYYTGATGPTAWHHYAEELMLMKKAARLGTKAMIPPEVRSAIHAKTVEVRLPQCVGAAALRSLSGLFQDLGAGIAVNLVSQSTPNFPDEERMDGSS